MVIMWKLVEVAGISRDHVSDGLKCLGVQRYFTGSLDPKRGPTDFTDGLEFSRQVRDPISIFIHKGLFKVF